MAYKDNQSAEELVAGLRRRGGHLPTKVSEAARKKKEAAKSKKRGYERYNMDDD